MSRPYGAAYADLVSEYAAPGRDLAFESLTGNYFGSLLNFEVDQR